MVVLAILAAVLPAVGTVVNLNGHPRTQILEGIFSHLGVRSEGVMVRLSPNAADTVRSASSLHGIPASLCRLPGSGYLMSDAVVLWHGIGSRSYLRWPARTDSRVSQKELKTDVPSGEVSIVRGPPLRCVDVPDSAFFESGRAEQLSTVAGKGFVNALLSHLASAENAGQRLIGMDVIGNADPMPIGGGNQRLALERATQVVNAVNESEQLMAEIKKVKVEPRPASNGARDPV